MRILLRSTVVVDRHHHHQPGGPDTVVDTVAGGTRVWHKPPSLSTMSEVRSQRRGSSRPGSQGVSKETQALLGGMMKNARLTPFQQRQLTQHLQQGKSPLPVQVNPTSSKVQPPPSPRASPASQSPRVLNPRTVQGAGKRSAEHISLSGCLARPTYAAGPRGRDRDQLREELSDTMAFGKELVETKKVEAALLVWGRQRSGCLLAKSLTLPAPRTGSQGQVCEWRRAPEETGG